MGVSSSTSSLYRGRPVETGWRPERDERERDERETKNCSHYSKISKADPVQATELGPPPINQ